MSFLTSWQELEDGERKARLRALAAVARLVAGPAVAADLVARARRAETEPDHLPAVDAALGRLPALTMRRVLASLVTSL